jgi:hypothetical protein
MATGIGARIVPDEPAGEGPESDALDYDRELVYRHILAVYPAGRERDAWVRWLDEVVLWKRDGSVGAMPEAPRAARVS